MLFQMFWCIISLFILTRALYIITYNLWGMNGVAGSGAVVKFDVDFASNCLTLYRAPNGSPHRL